MSAPLSSCIDLSPCLAVNRQSDRAIRVHYGDVWLATGFNEYLYFCIHLFSWPFTAVRAQVF